MRQLTKRLVAWWVSTLLEILARVETLDEPQPSGRVSTLLEILGVETVQTRPHLRYDVSTLLEILVSARGAVARRSGARRRFNPS